MKEQIKGGALTELSFCIMLSSYTPRHGYGVMRFITEKTGGRKIIVRITVKSNKGSFSIA